MTSPISTLIPAQRTSGEPSTAQRVRAPQILVLEKDPTACQDYARALPESVTLSYRFNLSDGAAFLEVNPGLTHVLVVDFMNDRRKDEGRVPAFIRMVSEKYPALITIGISTRPGSESVLLAAGCSRVVSRRVLSDKITVRTALGIA
jgi:hypothetical protein